MGFGKATLLAVGGGNRIERKGGRGLAGLREQILPWPCRAQVSHDPEGTKHDR
jgi:hypothetical protein